MKEYSRLEVSLTQSDNETAEWQDSIKVGYICALTFISICIAIFCIAPNVYWVMCHYKLNESGARIAGEGGTQSSRTSSLWT